MKQRQIHCLLDCIAYVIEQDGRFDYRPAYMGVWDYPIAVTKDGISYYGDGIRLDGVFKNLERMYGFTFQYWIRDEKSKEEHYAAMEEQAESGQRLAIITLVDLYYLPHSLQYQKKHYPHLLLVDGRSGSDWLLTDPYFGWSGTVTETVMRQAFGLKKWFTGISLNLEHLHNPNPVAVSQMFQTCIRPQVSMLADEVRKYLEGLLLANSGGGWKNIQSRIEDVMIIAKRLHGYTPIFSYFTPATGVSLAAEEERIAALYRRWESLLLAIFRASLLGKPCNFNEISDKLQHNAALEKAIKESLVQRNDQWRQIHEPNAG